MQIIIAEGRLADRAGTAGLGHRCAVACRIVAECHVGVVAASPYATLKGAPSGRTPGDRVIGCPVIPGWVMVACDLPLVRSAYAVVQVLLSGLVSVLRRLSWS